MRIRGRGRRALPPDVESSTLQPLSHRQTHLHPPLLATKSSISFEQDVFICSEEDEDTAEGKNPIATKPRKYACNPSSETSADTDSSVFSSSHYGHWLEEDKVLPLKKRRISVQLHLKSKKSSNTTIARELKSSETTRAKRKRTEKIWTDYVLQVEWVAEKARHKTRNNGERCNRQNGKRWRCSLPAFAGHTLCEHHLTEQRKKTEKKKKKKSKTVPQSRLTERTAEAASASSCSVAAKNNCTLRFDCEDDI